jgi:hypothetical protein
MAVSYTEDGTPMARRGGPFRPSWYSQPMRDQAILAIGIGLGIVLPIGLWLLLLTL